MRDLLSKYAYKILDQLSVLKCYAGIIDLVKASQNPIQLLTEGFNRSINQSVFFEVA